MGLRRQRSYVLDGGQISEALFGLEPPRTDLQLGRSTLDFVYMRNTL